VAEYNDLTHPVPDETPAASSEETVINEPQSEEPAPASQPEAPVQDQTPEVSYFYGTTLQLIGWRLLGFLLCILTLGIGTPWAQCMVYRWQINHTTVGGKDLHFNGKGHQLLGRYLLWGLLIIITLGIYAIFLPVQVRKWFLKHTSIATGNEPPQKSGGPLFVFLAAVLLCIIAVIALFKPAARGDSSRWEDIPANTPIFTQATDPNQTTEPDDIWYVTATVGLHVREEPSEDSAIIDTLKYGTAVKVEYWENGFAYIGSGWCSGSYLSQTNPNPLPQQGNTQTGQTGQTGQTNQIDSAILGTWREVKPCTHPYDSNAIAYHLGFRYVFNSDGTFTEYPDSETWEYDPQTGTATLLSSWDANNICEGTYTYSGSVLTLTYLVDHGHPDREGPWTYVYENVTISGNTMRGLVHSDSVFERGTPEEILARLYGQTTTPIPPANDAYTTIIGAPWRYARYDADTGRLHLGNSYMFNADGTFSGTYTDSSYYFDGAQWVWDHTMGTGGQSFEGTYTFDGSTLVLTYTYMEWEDTVPAPRTCTAYVDHSHGSVFYIDGTPYYTGSLETISNLLCPNPSVSAPSPVPPADPAIVGKWTDIWYDPAWGKLVQNAYYTFASDGTFSGAYGDRSYLYSTAEGWIYDVSAASGSEQFSGTYQYDGSSLVLTFDFMEWSDIPAPKTCSAYISGGVLYIDSRAHYQGSTNEIGNLLCPDPISAGAALLDASIFGTWHGFRFNGDRLEQWKTYIFSSDGTVEFCTQDTYYQYSEETGLSCYGSGSDSAYTFYRYDGTTLSFTNDHRTAIISGNTLTINGETYYRGDPDTIALQLFTQQ
jgi:hypothetical protein